MLSRGSVPGVLDAKDNIPFRTIYQLLNECFGTHYTAWMRCGWAPKSKHFSIWVPKLAETKNGKLVPAAFGCINTISDDWNTVVFDDLKFERYIDEPPKYVHASRNRPCLIFAKEPHGGPYIFRGVYVYDESVSHMMHSVNRRIASRVRLIGDPVEDIELLDSIPLK